MNDRQRLEAIVGVVCRYLPPDGIPVSEAMSQIIALVDPLPAPVQEPVAWMFEDDEDNGHKTFRQTPPSPEVVAYLAKWNRPAWVPLYTTPPAPQPVPVKTYHDGKPWPVAPKPWVGLTDDDIHEQGWNLSADRDYEAWTGREFLVVNGVNDFARAIEAKLKEKNT